MQYILTSIDEADRDDPGPLLRPRDGAPRTPRRGAPRGSLQGARRPDARRDRQPPRRCPRGLRLRPERGLRPLAADDLAPPEGPPRRRPRRLDAPGHVGEIVGCERSKAAFR